MKRYALALVVALGTVSAVSLPPVPVAWAQDAPMQRLVIEMGSGKVIRTGKPIANLFAADPKIAEVRPASPTSVFVFGVALGRTTVAAFDDGGAMIAQYDVVVEPSTYAAGEAARHIASMVPNGTVHYEPTPNGLAVTGRVATPEDADRAITLGKTYAGKDQTVDDRLTVASDLQVNLRVRIAEIQRNVTRQLGINWLALGKIGRWGLAGAVTDGVGTSNTAPNQLQVTYNGTSSLDAIIDALAVDGLVTILAEPNLVARSGETASFLAGGEFPVPISAQSNTITVAFKQYGVSLTFVPTVLSSDRISMRVRPEVSELSTTGAVSVPIGTGSLFGGATVTIPALTVRRAETTVELGSGQSFAIAGLLQNSVTTTAQGLPFLGELPVLGPLFKSDLFQHNESELVIVVTPYLVKPANVANTLHTPMDNFLPANDFDRAVLLRQRARDGAPSSAPGALGDAGFLLN
jgi:pilus assembly protein CpaC